VPCPGLWLIVFTMWLWITNRVCVSLFPACDVLFRRRNIVAGYSESVSMSLVLSPSTSWTSFTIPQGRWICDKWCTYDFPQLVFARVFARHTIARSFKLLMLTNENSRGWHYWPSGRGQLGYSIILLRFVDRSITPCYKEPTSSRRTYCSSPRAHKFIHFR
jgi:hypothetical protein